MRWFVIHLTSHSVRLKPSSPEAVQSSPNAIECNRNARIKCWDGSRNARTQCRNTVEMRTEKSAEKSAIGWMPALLLCPKCGSQSIGLVPKRTIPLGGKYTYTHFFFSKFSLSEPCRFLFLFQNSICPVTKSRRVEKLIHNCFNGCQNVSIIASK